MNHYSVPTSLSSKLTEVLEKYMYNAYEQVALSLPPIALIRERKGCQTALNDQPIANISDNEDDNDDETANSDTPRFEFDALTASTDSRRLASQRRFQPGRPASGTIPRDFIHQRQFQPNCPPPNINQYCFIPQQQFQPNHATTDTIPRDFISQQQLHFARPDFFSQTRHPAQPGAFHPNPGAGSGRVPVTRPGCSTLNTTADPLQQSQVRDKTIEKVGKRFLPEFMRLSE
ncbi:unnamed protein product [Rotaria socialis]|uniref:Uncharacterized protein n=1 Tax=Rotaria socialis TaxID=392032 RepID=A0A818EHM0_9BILA|nr:unnamed protein product [Rotaria socialis]